MPPTCASSLRLTFAGIPRSLTFRVSDIITARTIGSNRLHCYSSSSAKQSESMDIETKSGKVSVKESLLKSRTMETEIIGDASDTIERMTVHELRSKLRSVGVPAKGRKSDLMSALRGFQNSKEDGEGEMVVDYQQSSKKKPKCTEQNSSTGKIKCLSSDEGPLELDTSLEISEIQSTKRGVKQFQVADSNKEVKTTLHTTTHKLSIKIDEVSGKKSSQLKRKARPEIATGVVAASDEAIDQDEPWAVFAHKKPQKGWRVYNPRTMRPPPPTGDTKSLKLMSWNVNGLRALLKLERLSALQLAQREDFDVLCLQETKLQD